MQVTTFNFDAAAVRVQIDGHGLPWFNARDICTILEFGNPRQAVESHVDGDDVQKLDVIDNLGRAQQANHVNESGLYALILGSTKEAAKRFKRWVTSEVLPSIHKTGSYSASGADAIIQPRQSDAADMLFRSVELGVMSKSRASLVVQALVLSSSPGAAAILAALQAAQSREAAPVQPPTPAQPQLSLELHPAPTKPKRAAPKPVPFPILKLVHPMSLVSVVDGSNFVLHEIAQYVEGGETELMAALRARGLVNEFGAPTDRAKVGLCVRRAGGRYHWNVLKTLRICDAIK